MEKNNKCTPSEGVESQLLTEVSELKEILKDRLPPQGKPEILSDPNLRGLMQSIEDYGILGKDIINVFYGQGQFHVVYVT